ncbi:MAG: isochorismate synthase [Synechococcaceae cyanobacterium]|nr:isochorismate synthase [Synechococcaceae cyanobacterium]
MQAPSTVPTASFTGLLAAADRAARRLEADALRRGEEPGVLSLALPLTPLDPLLMLPLLEAGPGDADGGSGPVGGGFRYLWDSAPGLCLAASGHCNSLELSGPRRFELAQRFSSLSLSRLAQAPQSCPALARPRVLLAFAFFDSPLEAGAGPAGVQAVLPRWQLSRQGRHCWLRLQRSLGGEITPRRMAEELWDTARRLERQGRDAAPGEPESVGVLERSCWHDGYRSAVEQGLALVDEGQLQKLVLAVRQQLWLDGPLDPLQLLAHLRRSQPGSCRFLWQASGREALLGASPERLLTVRQGQLRSDALAGTASAHGPADELLRSGKDLHEHALVVETINTVLERAGLLPRRPRHPRLARHGSLVHLHTPITASLAGQQPLALAEALHPTPAVAGLPRREAMGWLRSLEPFERGHYAAPIGWIDSAGDADLRVAIRSGVLRGRRLELTAGAGLVRGSLAERELREIDLKLGVLQQQLTAAAPAAIPLRP